MLDLMNRCEHEIINKINSVNVTDILLIFHPIKYLMDKNTESDSVRNKQKKEIMQKCILRSHKLAIETDPDLAL